MQVPFIVTLLLLVPQVLIAGERPRLAVLTDIGADPDDQQSLVRLMVYSNEFELEALIATGCEAPGDAKKARTQPQLILEMIAGYEQVLPSLRRHGTGWPHPGALRECVKSAHPQRGRE